MKMNDNIRSKEVRDKEVRLFHSGLVLSLIPVYTAFQGFGWVPLVSFGVMLCVFFMTPIFLGKPGIRLRVLAVSVLGTLVGFLSASFPDAKLLSVIIWLGFTLAVLLPVSYRLGRYEEKDG